MSAAADPAGRQPGAAALTCRAALLLACAVGLAPAPVAAATLAAISPAIQPGPIVLPPPGGNPLAIDFAHDPLLGFGRTPAPVQPFLETLGRAVAAHPVVQAAIVRVAAASGVRTQVRAGLFPQIDVQLTASRALARDFTAQSAVVDSLQPRGRTDASLVGNQLLFDFGANGNRIAAANARIEAARAELERSAGDVALHAISAWYEIVGYQSLVDLGGAAVIRQRQILADVRTRAAQGLGADSDTARAEAVLAGTETQVARFERLLDQARGRYREAFGSDAPSHLDRVAPPLSQAHSIDAAEALAHASPAVQAGLRRAEAARRDWRAVRADGLPRFSAGFNATRYNVFQGSFAGPDYEVRGTLSLRQSLFAGGHQRGVIAEAEARSREAAFNADQVSAETERDAGIAFSDVASLARAESTLATAYAANRRARDGYVEQFRVSRGTLIELLRAEQDYFAAATNYLQGVVELDVARFTLLARTGEILDVAGVKFSAEGS